MYISTPLPPKVKKWTLTIKNYVDFNTFVLEKHVAQKRTKKFYLYTYLPWEGGEG